MASKSVWNLPGGPWERLFGGVWNRFNVAVYENEDKTLLTTLFPKSGEVSWIMVRVDKILLAPLGIEKIEDKLSGKSLHILRQRLPGNNMTYLILLSPPSTLDFGSEEIGSSVFQKVMDLNKEADEIKAIAKKSGVEIIDFKDAQYKDSANVLGNPTLLLSLLSVAPEGEEPKRERLREFVLGENESGQFKIEESVFGSMVSIKKGTEEERNYLAQAILEHSIIDAAPIPIILDFSSRSLKLDQPNPYPYDYSKFGLSAHNVAFKVRLYDMSAIDSDFKINLNQMSPQFIWKLFGLGVDEASTLIVQSIYTLQQSGMVDGVGSIMESIDKAPKKTDKEKATAAKALRILRAIGKVYGSIFSKNCDTLGIMSEWLKKNETIYVSMTGLDNRKRLAVLSSIFEGFDKLKTSKNLSEIEVKRLEYLFPALLNMDWFGAGLLQSDILEKIVSNHKSGLFTAEGDLPIQIESRVAYRFQIVGPGRVKLYTGGRGVEFDLRPLLSCPP